MITHASVGSIYLNLAHEKKLIGRMATKDRRYYFEYDPAFLQTGIQLSPFKLPLKAGIIECDTTIFEGIFGIFNDSLPDGWGRLLLDRKLLHLNQNPNALTPLDRLLYVGNHGMGALSYEPEKEDITSTSHQHDLDIIADHIQQFQDNNDHDLDELLSMNGSSNGARPKVTLKIGREDWLVKFRSSLDPFDIGPIEFAYHTMASAAGLVVPTAKLFESKNGPGYFGVKRFDRNHQERFHMHSISGLLHADYRIPSLDYKTIIGVTQRLTKNYHECEKQFRSAVFNVLAHNRDDHAKNFSFLFDMKSGWLVSPAYDLTFSTGPGGEHCTMVMGEGNHPGMPHLLKLAETAEITKERAHSIIEEVRNAVSNWDKFAMEAGVSKTANTMIRKAIL